MTEDTEVIESEQSQQTTFPERDDIDPAYRFMLDELEEEFGDFSAEFGRVLKEHVRKLYDNREELRQQMEQQQ